MTQQADTSKLVAEEFAKRAQSLGTKLIQKRHDLKLSTKLQREFYRRLTVSTNKNTNFTLDELMVLSEGLFDIKGIDGIDLICKYEFEKREEVLDKLNRPKSARPASAELLKEVKERIEKKARNDVIKHLERKSRNKYVVVPKHLEMLHELDPINIKPQPGEAVPVINTSYKVHEISFDNYKRNRKHLLNSASLSSNPKLAKQWIDRKFPSLAEMQARPIDYIDPKIFDENYNFLQEIMPEGYSGNYSGLEGAKAKRLLKLLTQEKKGKVSKESSTKNIEEKVKEEAMSKSGEKDKADDRGTSQEKGLSQENESKKSFELLSHEQIDFGELVKQIRREQKYRKNEVRQQLLVEEIERTKEQPEDPNFKVILGPRTNSGVPITKPPIQTDASQMIKEAMKRLRHSIISKQREALARRMSMKPSTGTVGEVTESKKQLGVIQEDNRSKSLSKSNTSFSSSSSDSSSAGNEVATKEEKTEKLVRDSHLGILKKLSLVPESELRNQTKEGNPEELKANPEEVKADPEAQSQTPAETGTLTARESNSSPDDYYVTPSQKDSPGLKRDSSVNSESSRKSFFSVVKFATNVKAFHKSFRLRREKEEEIKKAQEEVEKRWLNRDEKAEEEKHESVKQKAEAALRLARESVFQARSRKLDKSPALSQTGQDQLSLHSGGESNLLKRRGTLSPLEKTPTHSFAGTYENVVLPNVNSYSIDMSLGGRVTPIQQSCRSVSPQVGSERQPSLHHSIAIKPQLQNLQTEAWKRKLEGKQEEQKVRKERLEVRDKFRKNRLLNISKSARQHSAGSKIIPPSKPAESVGNMTNEGHETHRHHHHHPRERMPLGNFFKECNSIKKDVEETKNIVDKRAWETRYTYESQGKILQRLSNLDYVEGKALEYMYLYNRNLEAQQIQNVEEARTEFHKPQKVSSRLFKARSKAVNTLHQ